MDKELRNLSKLLGEELLTSLLNVSAKKLRCYSENPNRIPSHIDDKLRNVSAIVRNLRGCYAPHNIRKFFENKNSRLGHKRPRDIMKGDWWPRDAEILRVLELSGDMQG